MVHGALEPSMKWDRWISRGKSCDVSRAVEGPGVEEEERGVSCGNGIGCSGEGLISETLAKIFEIFLLKTGSIHRNAARMKP